MMDFFSIMRSRCTCHFLSVFFAIVALNALLLAACAVGPDFHPSAPPQETSYTPEALPRQTTSTEGHAGAPQRFVMDMDIPGQWWTLFRNENLNRLVEQALRNNPTLDVAQATLRQAWEGVYAQQGSYWPQVSAQGSASRNLTAVRTVSAASASGNPYYSLLTPELNVSFVPDVFGANHRLVESLRAQAESQRYQLEATYLTLTSNVVAAAVQEASLRGQIAATEKTIKIETDLLKILRRQLALGQVAGSDVAAQEAALAQAQQALPPFQKQLEQQRNLIANLVGQSPSQQPTETFELGALTLPVELPVSLPAKLVAQRPDVQAAEANLHSASAQVGIALAARLPQITLTAQIGYQAAAFSQLFMPGTSFWTIAAGLTQPVFQGGALLHKQRATEAAFEQAKAQYRSTVLVAMQNVADTLRALQADADALRAALASERAAFRSLEIVRRQLALGQVAYLALLNAEQTYQQVVLTLVQAEANRLADTAALIQALGGGWWNRADVKVNE
jgi:NodT family efflux transporter outer membrane factor (OMF) lipoprotein